MSSTPIEPSEQEPVRIPVVEEQLAVGTRMVDTGRGVRIHKTVTEHPVAIDERLLREELRVEHVPVDRICLLYTSPSPRD